MERMKLHEGAGLGAALGGMRDRREVTHERSQEPKRPLITKTTSEVITCIVQGNYLRGRFGYQRSFWLLAAFVCDFPPAALAQQSWAPNPALSDGTLNFMDLHGTSW